MRPRREVCKIGCSISCDRDLKPAWYDVEYVCVVVLTAFKVLGGVGDAMGYYGGSWEFNHSGASIHKELHAMTKGVGISGLHLHGYDWRVSDGT